MDPKVVLIIVLIVVLIIVVITRLHPTTVAAQTTAETFTTRDDKARVILEWFREHPNATYRDYRRDTNMRSNIVEYADMRDALMAKPDLTVHDTLSIIA